MQGYLSVLDPGYPGKLAEHLSDPRGIYYAGDPGLADKTGIAVVGSRKATGYGIAVAKELGARAAQLGVIVICGLARGIDSAAHRGALEAGGKTIAVLGNGIDTVYPRENRKIQDEIASGGLLITEYGPGTPAAPYRFPERNRLIAALADAVIVVEAETRSGSLITAEAAMEMGKEVYAVPGNITSTMSMGTNKLLRDAARPLVILDDVFQDLGIDVAGTRRNAGISRLGEDERRLFEIARESGEISVESLRRRAGMSAAEIAGLVSVLEMKGMVYCELGKIIVAKSLL